MVSKRRQYFCFGVMISAGSRLFSKVLICLLDKVKTFIPILQYFEFIFQPIYLNNEISSQIRHAYNNRLLLLFLLFLRGHVI